MEIYYRSRKKIDLHLIDNIVFQPVIFSNSVKAHPLEIFVVVLASGFAAGIPGMILGIPAYTVIRVLAREFFYNFKPIQKITSSLSNENINEKIGFPLKENDKKSDGTFSDPSSHDLI